MLHERQRSQLLGIFKLQPLVEIWKSFHDNMRRPGFPHLQVPDCHVGPVKDAQSQMLEGVEDGSGFGGLSRTDASDGRNNFLGANLKDPNAKDILLVSFVDASGNHIQTASMAMVNPARLQSAPQSSSLKGGLPPMTLTKGKLDKTPAPQFRISVLLYAVFPELTSTQGASAFNAMQRSLMESSDGSGQFVACLLLKFEADGPVQGLLKVLTSLVPGELDESLPSEFFLKLHVERGPSVVQGDMTIRDGSIANPDPLARILKIKAIVEKIGLQSLEWSCHYLPSVLGLCEGSESRTPTGHWSRRGVVCSP